jgi:hypothetical protein
MVPPDLLARPVQPHHYGAQASGPLAHLLADPFSSFTRTRQVALLIAATAALLLSARLLSITNVGAGGITALLGGPPGAEVGGKAATQEAVALVLAFFVTLYLLITYILAVLADWAIAKARGSSWMASIEDVESAIRLDDQRLEEARKTIEEERQKLGEEEAPDPAASVHRIIIAGKRISMTRERQRIDQLMKTFSRLTYLRLLIEVWFPILYGAVALAVVAIRWAR